MKFSLYSVALILALLPCGARAGRVVVDFEDLPPPIDWDFNVLRYGSPVLSSGFEFSVPVYGFSSFIPSTPFGIYTGSAALCADVGPITMMQVGGGAFTLNSMEVANLVRFVDSAPTIVFTGTLLNGRTVIQSFTLSKIDTPQLVKFTDFNEVTSVTWNQSGQGHQFDNIVTNAPTPAAAIPFALMALRRRKRA